MPPVLSGAVEGAGAALAACGTSTPRRRSGYPVASSSGLIAQTASEAAAAVAGGEQRENVPDLLQPLNSSDPHVRQATCQALARPSLRGDPRAATALIARMQDRDQYVRQAAATSLGQISRRGDEASIAALVARLSDVDPGVRRVSTNSLGQVAQRGCAAAIGGLLGRLEDRDGGVRRAALKGIEKVTEKSDGRVLGALFNRTSDGEAVVRHTAVEVLSRVAEEGDQEVVSRLLQLLDSDRDPRVRWAATEALGRLAVRGDSRVLTALLGRLDDEADSVRRAAASALGHVTFAPLEELKLQERHIAEIEFRGAHEVANRDKTITQMEDRHALEVNCLQRRVDELEDRLRREVEERDQRIRELETQRSQQDWLARVGEFLPHAVPITQFLAQLPSLAGPAGHGVEVIAPIWALRCARASGNEPEKPKGRQGGFRTGSICSGAGVVMEEVSEGKDRRWLLSLFELFEQLSTGRVTPMELTNKTPLDVYVHQADDEAWGLYCCSHSRMLALLMRQACARSELLTVKCVIRPKDDQSFWGWQWATHYDGGNGLYASMERSEPGDKRGSTAGLTMGPRRNSLVSPPGSECGQPPSSPTLSQPSSTGCRGSFDGRIGGVASTSSRPSSTTRIAAAKVGPRGSHGGGQTLRAKEPPAASIASPAGSARGSRGDGFAVGGALAASAVPTVTMELLGGPPSGAAAPPARAASNGAYGA